MSEVPQRPVPTTTVEPISEADMREAMMGTNGNPTYEEQFGITSAPLGTTGTRQPTMAELEFQAKLAEARALDPNAFAATVQPGFVPSQEVTQPDEASHYKQLYGQSENEKGQMRKAHGELMEAFNGLMGQYEALQSQGAQGQQWQAQPTQQYVGPQGFGYGQPQQSFDPYEGMNDDDVVQGRQVKGLVERTIAPLMQAAWQQAQQASQRTAQLEQQLLSQAKAQSGISKLDEFRLVAKNPWLASMPAPAKLAALASLKQAELATQPTANQTQAIDTQQRIVNKVTYIEGNRPQTADSSAAAVDAAKARDYAAAMAQDAETGARARALRSFANKYGLNLGQNPSDLAR